MRTPQEIGTEVLALKALRPIGPHAASTQRRIDLAIEELTFGVDDTSEEFEEMSSSDQDMVNATRYWKEGDSNDRPSEGWGPLVEQPKKKGK